MRRLLMLVALAPLAACVGPEMAGDYMRVATINNVRLDEVPGTYGVYEVSVRATADGTGWSDPQLRVVRSDPGHDNELTLALYARAPSHAMRRNYDAKRASDGDTYPVNDDHWNPHSNAIDTYFGHGGTPLEAKLVVNPGSEDRIVRVIGQANDWAAAVADLKHANADLLIHPDGFGRYRQNMTVIEIGPGVNPVIRWNGTTLADRYELEAKVAAYSGRDNTDVRIIPDRDADPQQVSDVMEALKRYRIGVRRYDPADRGRDEYGEPIYHSDVAPQPVEGFWFPKLDR